MSEHMSGYMSEHMSTEQLTMEVGIRLFDDSNELTIYADSIFAVTPRSTSIIFYSLLLC